jgi:hypothetical protein
LQTTIRIKTKIETSINLYQKISNEKIVFSSF